MQHTIDRVAGSHFLNSEKLMAFAQQPDNQARYALTASGSEFLVSSWYVDDFVKAFKETQSDADLKADRRAVIDDMKRVLDRC